MSYIKGDICICIIPYEFGEGSKSRPIVFWDDWELSKDRPTVLVIPLTSVSAKQRYQATFLIRKSSTNKLREDSILKIYQLSSISKDNISRVIGRLSDTEIQAVTELLRQSFPNIY